MAFDLFVRIDGIDGESADGQHKGSGVHEIERKIIYERKGWQFRSFYYERGVIIWF